MTEHTLTQRTGWHGCSCGEWTIGQWADEFVTQEHAKHVQTEADWDAIGELFTETLDSHGRSVSADVYNAAFQAYGRLRGAR